MKNKNILKKTGFGAALLLSVIFSSCVKNNDSNVSTLPVSLVTVIQASPDQPALDFFVNADRVNTSPLTFGGGINYFKAYTGTRTLNFYLTGTTTSVFSDTVTFNQNVIYSIFLANKPGQQQLVKLIDTLKQPASGYASVRYVNLSPDAPATDLIIKGSTTTVGNKAFKGYSSFLNVKGDTTLNLEVHQAGTATVLASLQNVTFHSGYAYTVWLKGLATPTNSTDALSISIITNAYSN